MFPKTIQKTNESIIYSPVTKTSSSGFFSNKRLAILSLTHGIMAYMSKVPEPLHSFDFHQWVDKCKQYVFLRDNATLKYWIDQNNEDIVKTSWSDKEEQKNWEFKFDSKEVAKEWLHNMELARQVVVKPTEPQIQEEVRIEDKEEEKVEKKQEIDYSKMKQKQSRFRQKQNQHKNDKKQHYRSQQPVKQQQRQRNPNQSRFLKYEQRHGQQQKQDENLPMITTFKQQFAHQAMKNMTHPQEQGRASPKNWNLRWFQVIDTQSEQDHIDINNDFVLFCKKIVEEILKELTQLKRYRKHVPVKISAREEVYNIEQVEFRLIKPDRELVATDYNQSYQLFQAVFQEHQNNRYILQSTYNSQVIRVPLNCVVKYAGLVFSCQALPPRNYEEISKSSMTLFRKQIQKLESKIKLKINKEQINLFCNKQFSFSGNLPEGEHIIILNLGMLMPLLKIPNSSLSFYLPTDYLYNSVQPTIPEMIGEQYLNEYQAMISSFNSEQATQCSIISVQDLQTQLKNNKISKNLIYLMVRNDKNSFIHSLLASQLVAIQVEKMLWMSMGSIIRQQDIEQTDLLSTFQNLFLSLIQQLIKPEGSTWETVTAHLSSSSITIKQKDILIGYLFSSISIKTGIDFNYDLLMTKKGLYFKQGMVFPKQSVRKFDHICMKYADQDISQMHAMVVSTINQKIHSQQSLQEVVDFYNLLSGQPSQDLDSYHWRKICKLMSSFVPFEKQEEFAHLNIFQQTTPEHLDHPVFSTLLSAIKWLLVEDNHQKAQTIIEVFEGDCWFWIGNPNFFMIQLWELLGKYFEQKGQFDEAAKYFDSAVKNSEKIVNQKQNEKKNMLINYRLAKMHKLKGNHRQSLKKFNQVKKCMSKKQQKPSFLEVSMQTASLYLHLGSVNKCFLNVKEAIDHSILNSFPDEQSQFRAYELILRCLEITEDDAKYKFYLGVLEDKFKMTQNWHILQEVLRYSFKCLIKTVKSYLIKKLVFFMYGKEVQRIRKGEQLNLEDLFLKIKQICNEEDPSFLLKQYIERSQWLIDQMSLMKKKERQYNPQEKEKIDQETQILSTFLEFVGTQYILGLVVSQQMLGQLKQNK